MSIYQEHILDHYHHPRFQRPLESPTHTAESNNLSCGDQLHVDIVVKNGILEAVHFHGIGCAISQASASILLESVQGQSVTQIQRLTSEDLLTLLGIPLSPARVKCALLSLETLHQALSNSLESPPN
jgi:nitrogen fixation NifU-like protein